MSPEIKGFQFGSFVLDCEEQVLLLDGEPVSLTPKAFLLLKTLVENHGRVIAKSDLMEAVWPDSFVEEGNLPFTAFYLRKTLGDSKDDPRFIETVPRRGYKFIAPVTPIFADPAEPEAAALSSTAGEPIRDKRRWPRLALAAAAAGLVLAGWGIWFVARAWNKPATPILSQPFSVEQLSTSGNSANAAISPDGKYVIYSDESGAKQSLWLRNLDTTESVQIVPPSDDEYLGLTFSSSGTSVYFVRLPTGVHALPSLYRIETVGGVPVKLADHVNKRISLSGDDTRMAFARCRYRKSDFCSVIVADANGAN
jgi:DNA-binding winged helix-turn-helix (wHTH) protein